MWGARPPDHTGSCTGAVQGADPCLASLGLDLTGLPSPGLILTLWDDIPAWPQPTTITMAVSGDL